MMSSARHLFVDAALHFFVRDAFLASRDGPDVTERVADTAFPRAEEHVRHRHHDLGAGRDGARKQLVRIGDIELGDQAVCRPALHRLAQIEARVADLQLTVNDLPIWQSQLDDLLGAQGSPEELDGFLRVVDDDVRRDGVKAFRKKTDAHEDLSQRARRQGAARARVHPFAPHGWTDSGSLPQPRETRCADRYGSPQASRTLWNTGSGNWTS